MRSLPIVFCCLFFGLGFSQTKLISHKSHSGTDANFRIALKNNLFDIGDSNLGAAPDRFERNAKLDSVIYVSDKEVILVTSEHCVSSDRQDYKIINSKVWRAGREKVYHNALFSKNHSLDSVKTILKEQYNFRNNIDETVFVGFDNGEKPAKKSKKKSIIPFFKSEDNSPSKPILILVLISLLLILTYFFYKKSIFKSLSSH